MDQIVRVNWTLEEASKELGISKIVIKKTIKTWPLRMGLGNKDKIILNRKVMRYLHLFVRTKMYYTFKGLNEMIEGKLNVNYNGDQLN